MVLNNNVSVSSLHSSLIPKFSSSAFARLLSPSENNQKLTKSISFLLEVIFGDKLFQPSLISS